MSFSFKLIITACILFFALTDTAFTQLRMSGELRPRSELRHGYKTLPADASDVAFFTEQRSRLNLNFMPL